VLEIKLKSPKVTVITVTFNAADFIEETIKSVVDQTYDNLEYIIVDGFSSDNTVDIAKKYHKQINQLISEPDQGIYDAMNKGTKLASGEWVLFMNAGDSFCNEGVIEKVFKLAGDKLSDTDLIYGNNYYKNGPYKIFQQARSLSRSFWKGMPFNHQSCFVKTKLMKERPFQNKKYKIQCEYDFLFNLYKSGYKFKYVDTPIANYLAGGISDRNFIPRTIERWKIVCEHDKSSRVHRYYFILILQDILKRLEKKLTSVKNIASILRINMKNDKGQNYSGDLISVIIPNYNNEKYILSCIHSVLNQSYKNIEIIVIDDDSIDGSIRILEKINNPKIQIIRNAKNIGVASTRNMGIRVAKGKYLTTLDADDILLDPRKLELELNCIKSKPNNKPVIAFSNIQVINKKSRKRNILGDNSSIVEGNIQEGLLSRTVFIPRDFLALKSLYVEAGLYDENIPIYEDWDLKIRMAEKAEFYYSGCIGVGYRKHGAGLSSKSLDELEMWENFVREKNSRLK